MREKQTSENKGVSIGKKNKVEFCNYKARRVLRVRIVVAARRD
jgi:hypothetical protein